jgi:hypothetical protein
MVKMKGKFTALEIVKISGKERLPDLVTILNHQFMLLKKINLSCLAKERCLPEIVNLILLPLPPHTHTHSHTLTHTRIIWTHTLTLTRTRIIWTHNSNFKGRVIRITPQRDVLLLYCSTVNGTSVTLGGTQRK